MPNVLGVRVSMLGFGGGKLDVFMYGLVAWIVVMARVGCWKLEVG